MPYVHYLPTSGHHEWAMVGAAAVYVAGGTGTPVGQTSRTRLPLDSTITDLWVSCPDVLAGGLITVDLVNLTTPFGTNPFVTATVGTQDALTSGLAATVPAGEILVARITALTATNAEDITIGYASRPT